MRPFERRFSAIGALGLLLVPILSAQAQTARRTRPGGSGTPVQHAAGHAHYGHGYGYGHYHGYPSGGWGGYGNWGYPYFWAGLSGPGWPWWSPAWAMQHAPNGAALPAALETDVQPKKAAVAVDGVTVGQARDFNGRWDQLSLKPGAHTIEFSAQGYQTLRREVHLEAGTRAVIGEALQRGQGIDPRSDPPRAARDVTPPAAPDSTPEVPSEGHGVARGWLKLDVRPPDAAVYLDGTFLGTGAELARLHGALAVARGAHVVEVLHPQFRSQRHPIDVPESNTLSFSIELGRD